MNSTAALVRRRRNAWKRSRAALHRRRSAYPPADVTGLAQAFLDWLNKPRKKKVIFFALLTLRYVSGGSVLTETLHISTHKLNTTEGDSPSNTPFRVLLRPEDIPPFRQEVKEPFSEGISLLPSGKLTIGNPDGTINAKLPPTRSWLGGTIEVKMTGDASEVPLSSAATVYKGRLGSPVRSEENIEVDIFSRHLDLENRLMPTATFTGPNSEVHLEPFGYGELKNIPLILVDSVNLVYATVTGPIQSIDNVFNNGVALVLTTDYTVNLTTGRVTLVNPLTGTLTADIKGYQISGTYSDKRGDFVNHALTNFGGLVAADLDSASFTQFNTDVPEASYFYAGQEMSVREFVSRLLNPVIGYLVETRSSKFKIGLVPLPVASPDLTLDRNDIIGRGREIPLSFVLNIATVRYDRNHTVQASQSLGDAAPVQSTTSAGRAKRAWLADEWRSTKSATPGATEGRNLVPTAEDVVVDSYFLAKAAADTYAARWKTFFGVQRYLIDHDFNLKPFQIDILAKLRLTNAWRTSVDTIVVMQEEGYGSGLVSRRLFL